MAMGNKSSHDNFKYRIKQVSFPLIETFENVASRECDHKPDKVEIAKNFI